MSDQEMLKGKVDRRTFLKVLGTAGASAAFVSVSATQALASMQPPAAPSASPLYQQQCLALATTGPGGNPNYQPADDLKFLPPEKIPDGKAADLFAALNKNKLLTAYQRMVVSRKWETKFKDLFIDGKDGLYGAFHMYIGEEAVANGVMTALNDDDYIVSTHRGHGHLAAKGGDLNKMSAEIFFKNTGYDKGYGGSMHMTDLSKSILGMNGIVGASWYIAAGAAFGALVRKSKQVAVAFGGDGAANSVYYFSAVRNAANMKLPVIFVIENNFQQQGIAMATVTPTKTLADYTKGLNVPSFTIDGNDITSVYATTKDALDRARSGGGPTVIETLTFRWYDHAGTAGAKVGVEGAFGLPYRSDEAVRAWMGRDPIVRYKTFLLDKKLATADELAKLETDAQAAVDASIEFARKAPDPKPSDGLLNVYAKGSVAPTQFFGAVAPAA
ncbi:MAG TPA: thiamine pyrophosphate-dependent dehydrogenase E1 component subunit alpha [Anaerolineae bacterium]